MSSIQYHDCLRVGQSITEKKLDKLKKRLQNHPLRTDVYLITTARNGIDQLEIYNSRQLAQAYYRNHPPFVIGITDSYEEALEMIQELVKECLQARGDCSLKEYLSC